MAEVCRMPKETLMAHAKKLKGRNSVIKSGKYKACKRHIDFFSCRKKRANLDFKCPVAGFSSSKLNRIVDILKQDFLIPSNSVSADYIAKVLLPETVIKDCRQKLFDVKVKS